MLLEPVSNLTPPGAVARLRILHTLRFAWHLTTLAWWGFAGLLFLLAADALTPPRAAAVVALTFLASGAVTLFASRGRHLAWIVFMAIGIAAGAAWYPA